MDGRPFFQTALVVPELEPALDELVAIGLRFGEPRDREIGPYRIRVAMSLDGPPYVELIEGAPGTPWDTSDGPLLHHIGFYTSALTEDRGHLVEEGLPLLIDGTEHGGVFSYHVAPASGLRVELVGHTPEGFRRRWSLPEPSAEGADGV